MNCTICKVKKISSRGGKTCGLECACKLNGDDYVAVRARMDQEIARMMFACNKGLRSKLVKV